MEVKEKLRKCLTALVVATGIIFAPGLPIACDLGWIGGKEKEIKSCTREEQGWRYVDKCAYTDGTRMPEICSYTSRDKIVPPVPDPGIMPCRIDPPRLYRSGDKVWVNVYNMPVRKILKKR